MSRRTIIAASIAISALSLSVALAGRAAAQAVAEASAAAANFGPADMDIDIGGSLLLPDGKPAGAASLYVCWADNMYQPQYRKIDVAANGRFRWHKVLKQIPKQVSGIGLFASASDIGSVFQSIPWSDIRKQSLSFKLEPMSTVTGRLLGPDNRALSDVKLAVKSIQMEAAERFATDPGRMPVFTLLRSIPDKVVRTGQTAITDKEGLFHISGIPRGTQVRIAPPDGFVFTSGSRTPVPVRSAVSHAGIFVAAKPGSLKLHLTDPTTGKPVPSAQISVLPAGALQGLLAQSLGGDGDPSGITASAANITDEKGEVTVGKLVPGDYSVQISGLERTITIRPGTLETMSLQVRCGALSGKVLDADGKPCGAASIVLEVQPGASQSRLTQLMAFNGGANVAAQTTPDGKFELQTFPWGVKEVTLRSARGNDEAEWKGDPATIKGPVILRMKHGALITVKAHMVDPAYKPLRACNVSVIRWRDDQPRLTWLLTAKQAKVDKTGQVAIEGLRRGESFSVLSGSPFAGGGQLDDRGFESPRFEVAAAPGASQQDLGDVVVHPLNGADQVIQIYGFESREQLARLSSLMSPPPAKEVDAARRALAAYTKAIDQGDLVSVQQATSRITPGWTSDISSFARSTSLRSCGSEEVLSAHPLRFIPRISLAYVLSIQRAQGPFNLNFSASARDLDENPDWVLFVSPKSANRCLGLLRREQGEWRVVNLASFPAGFAEQILLEQGTQLRNAGDLSKPAPRRSDSDCKTVESVAKEYLAAWKQEDAVRLQQLTSPFSTTWGKTPATMLQALDNRADEGRCPSRSVDSGVQLMDDLSMWETAWLAGYAGSIQQLSGGRPASPRVPAEMRKDFPSAFAARGDVAVTRYHAAEGDYLMVLVKFGGDWRVLEGAIPL